MLKLAFALILSLLLLAGCATSPFDGGERDSAKPIEIVDSGDRGSIPHVSTKSLKLHADETRRPTHSEKLPLTDAMLNLPDAWSAADYSMMVHGQNLPEIYLPSTDGEIRALSEFRGKKLLLINFASW